MSTDTGIEITVKDDSMLALSTEVMTLRDALAACRTTTTQDEEEEEDHEEEATGSTSYAPTDDSTTTTGSSTATGPQRLLSLSPKRVGAKYEKNENTNNISEDALYMDGATPLFKAIEEVNWREALLLVNEFPDQVKTWVRSTGTESTTFDWSLWRRLPIHEVR